MADLYGLIDTARDERLYDLVVSEPEHACLFEGKLDPDLARAAPYIVRLREGSRLLQAWETEGRGQSWGIQCTSDRSLTDLRRHFRHFLTAKLPNGEVILFRFYDPRVFTAYLESCTTAELAPWFRAVKRYQIVGVIGQGMQHLTLKEGVLLTRCSVNSVESVARHRSDTLA